MNVHFKRRTDNNSVSILNPQSVTTAPQYTSIFYSEVLDITNNILGPSNSKNIMKPCYSKHIASLNTLSGSNHFRNWLLDGTSNELCCLSLPQLDANISHLVGEEVTKFDMVQPSCLTTYPHNTWYISVSTFHIIIHVKAIFLVYPVFWSILA